MRIQISKRNLDVNDALRAHLERRLGFALGRFGDRIDLVHVRLSDISGHRGGPDWRCQLDVDLRALGVGAAIRVDDSDADLLTAVDAAVARASRSIARAVEREHETAHPRHHAA
jgi:putative sigma-54 modulation protein